MASFRRIRRRAIFAITTGAAIAIGLLLGPIVTGTLAPAQAQISEDAQIALEQYGMWRPHPRFGDVWVPAGIPPDWRPYQYGHWVYTDEWGWYWVSDDVEANWGWVVYHYGRWAFERGFGWFWVPGEEWAPAWVNWRYGDEYVGWAPLPPDELVGAYEVEPAYWAFVPGRYLAAPRLRTYFVPVYRRSVILRTTNIVNRTVPVHGARLAVNPGIPPAFVARVSGAPVATYHVRPRVFASTQGVSGAVQVRRDELRGPGPGGPAGPGRPGRPGIAPPPRLPPVSIQRTTTVVQPSATVTAPQPLGKNEPGRLGTHPPRAAQGAAPSIAPLQPSQPQPSAAPSPPPAMQRQTPAIQQAPAGVSPPSPKPPGPPASITAPATTVPLQRDEHRERVAPGGPPGSPPPQQPNIVRPIPPQAPPSPPTQQQRQVQPPPPPPPAARAPAPPPKKPPPQPGEKPEEKKVAGKKPDAHKQSGRPMKPPSPRSKETATAWPHPSRQTGPANRGCCQHDDPASRHLQTTRFYHLTVNERCRTLPPPQKLRSLLSQRPSESSLCYRYFDTP